MQPPFKTILTGEIQGGESAARMPDVSCSKVKFKAVIGNSGNIYIGVEGVTKVTGETNETAGYELDAGEESPWFYIQNLNELYMITDNNGDDVSYIAFK